MEPVNEKKGCQLPEGWVPGPQAIAYAEQHGLSAALIEREAERFRNWAAANGVVKRNWLATWRNWVLKACDIQGIAPKSPAVSILSDDERARLRQKYSKWAHK